MSKDKALPPDNHLKSVKMAVEGNMNMLDGIINNEPPKTAQGCLFISNKVKNEINSGTNHLRFH